MGRVIIVTHICTGRIERRRNEMWYWYVITFAVGGILGFIFCCLITMGAKLDE